MSTPHGLALLITAALNLCMGYKRAAASLWHYVRVAVVPIKKKILSLSCPFSHMYSYRTYGTSNRAMEETYNHTRDDILYLQQQLFEFLSSAWKVIWVYVQCVMNPPRTTTSQWWWRIQSDLQRPQTTQTPNADYLVFFSCKTTTHEV